MGKKKENPEVLALKMEVAAELILLAKIEQGVKFQFFCSASNPLNILVWGELIMSLRSLLARLWEHRRQQRKLVANLVVNMEERFCLLPLSKKLDDNLSSISLFLSNPADLTIRPLVVEQERELKGALVWLDGLVDEQMIYQTLLEPLLALAKQPVRNEPPKYLLPFLKNHVLTTVALSLVNNLAGVVDGILAGQTIVLIEGQQQALLADTKKWEKRNIEEPPSEVAIRGPREGFVEDLTTNIALVRKRLRNPRLRVRTITIGRQTQTQVAVVYIEGIANPKIVDEVNNRLQRIKIDAILADHQIEELIRDAPLSPFPTIANTERPDAAISGLLEGQVIIMVAGSPFALRLPAVFLHFFQAPEDYYLNFQTATFSRWLRLGALVISLVLPSLYVAITTFNPEMLPTPLLITLAAAREGIPFPVVVEALIMELAFEALREAGLRMPRALGQAVSIVGALVLGEAAIRAGLVSAPTVVVVAGTAIASFMLSHPDITAVSRLVRFPLLFLAGALGLFGIIAGLILVHLHMVSLRSFGVPYLSPLAPANIIEMRDILARWPLWSKGQRPESLTWRGTRRQGGASDPVRRNGRGGKV